MSKKRPNALQAPLQAKPRPGGICFDDSPCGETNWWCSDCPERERIENQRAWDQGEKRMEQIGQNGNLGYGDSNA